MNNNGSAAIIYSGNKILLHQRDFAKGHYPFHWQLFGGHMNDGETKEETLIRELEEELGVRFSIDKFNYLGEFNRVEEDGKLYIFEHYGNYTEEDFTLGEGKKLLFLKKSSLTKILLTPDIKNLFKKIK